MSIWASDLSWGAKTTRISHSTGTSDSCGQSRGTLCRKAVPYKQGGGTALTETQARLRFGRGGI